MNTGYITPPMQLSKFPNELPKFSLGMELFAIQLELEVKCNLGRLRLTGP